MVSDANNAAEMLPAMIAGSTFFISSFPCLRRNKQAINADGRKNSKFIAVLAQKEYDLSFLRELERQEAKLKRAINNIPGKELEDVLDGK